MSKRYTCPVCGKENVTLLCGGCGFDGSMDYEKHLTLQRIPQNVEAISARISAQENVLVCKRCGGKMFLWRKDHTVVCGACGTAAEFGNQETETTRKLESQSAKRQTKSRGSTEVTARSPRSAEPNSAEQQWISSGYSRLSIGLWDKAAEDFDNALRISSHPRAYVGRMMATMHIKKVSDIPESNYDIETNPDWINALKCATGSYKDKLQRYTREHSKRMGKKQMETPAESTVTAPLESDSVRLKIRGRLSCDYKELKDIPRSASNPIELRAPNNAFYNFEYCDTVVVNHIDYLVVSQPVDDKSCLFFIFKKTQNNLTVLICEGKALRRAYRAFQERNADIFQFEDLQGRRAPDTSGKKKTVKHFSQSAAVHQYRDCPSIPQVITVKPQYNVIDSFAFRQVCKGEMHVKEIIIPKTVQEIEANAFAGLIIDGQIVIPASVSYIGYDAFTLSQNGYVKCEEGSYAYNYCVKHGIRNSVELERCQQKNEEKTKEAIMSKPQGSGAKGHLKWLIAALVIILVALGVFVSSGTGREENSAADSSDSASLTGWQEIDGSRYYLNERGLRHTGWKTLNGCKFYFNSSGVMQTGWATIEGNRYYFGENGVMRTGWRMINGIGYEFGANGELLN